MVSSNGKTSDFGSENIGSIPVITTIKDKQHFRIILLCRCYMRFSDVFRIYQFVVYLNRGYKDVKDEEIKCNKYGNTTFVAGELSYKVIL